ncbi:MAG: hypothetical protein KBC17_03115 [Candidatus Pacebacteria bacterium]|nr:hypothetical protein [Candidatus Paceibacterota bacterium]
MKKLFAVVFVFMVGFFVLSPAAAPVVLADDEGPYLGLEYGEKTGLGASDIRITVVNVIKVILGLLGIIALSLIIYAGFLWMTAAGNEDNITKAKGIISASVIGLVIILSAYSITTFVFENLVGATRDGEEFDPN